MRCDDLIMILDNNVHVYFVKKLSILFYRKIMKQTQGTFLQFDWDRLFRQRDLPVGLVTSK